jgi:site-specific DNA recombinase
MPISMQRRPGFMAMLREIRMGIIRPDLLLLDTRERMGRADGVSDIRKELQQDYGVFILTADTRFGDPTTPAGRIYTVFEEERGKDENRVKAHQVLRGKIDMVKRKRWPGGKPPRGLKLESVLVDVAGRQETDGCVLVEDTAWSWIVNMLFERAAETGEGQTRLANFYNSNLDVPEKLKPLSGSSIGVMLDNDLYIGRFQFPKHCTDIVNDMFVKERNDSSVIIVIDDFCKPIVSRELWDRVHAIRDARREIVIRSRNDRGGPEKLIHPLSPGISIRHLLSGLVRCGHCGAAMRPSGPSAGKDPSRRYVYFRCPRSLDGICTNTQSIPVEWLNGVVISLLKDSLFAEH